MAGVKYEKRMRENSSLEKVFEYFAQHEKDGVRHMTATDMWALLVVMLGGGGYSWQLCGRSSTLRPTTMALA
ncbi:hypothetical protein HaLaN_07692 [Haematococcus lacustris]|uniref:Uncharacterized protein n=1 Tax=Haematococcus lacustris TaxID=44745 RepID=A0A699YS26_HAELA|nr:hypothetical protein HaLaN_07692 [Haematococcus lacustris]